MTVYKAIVPVFAKNVLQKEIIKDTIIINTRHQIIRCATVEINNFGIQNHFVRLIKKEAR